MKTATRVLSASTLKGQHIVNAKGDKLGHIDDIMLDIDAGRISYVVLSFGGFMGLGDKLFAVPMESLRPDGVNERFVMDISKEQLDKAPGFDKNNWPNHADTTFLQGVYEHYKVRPYWT